MPSPHPGLEAWPSRLRRLLRSAPRVRRDGPDRPPRRHDPRRRFSGRIEALRRVQRVLARRPVAPVAGAERALAQAGGVLERRFRVGVRGGDRRSAPPARDQHSDHDGRDGERGDPVDAAIRGRGRRRRPEDVHADRRGLGRVEARGAQLGIELVAARAPMCSPSRASPSPSAWPSWRRWRSGCRSWSQAREAFPRSSRTTVTGSWSLPRRRSRSPTRSSAQVLARYVSPALG